MVIRRRDPRPAARVVAEKAAPVAEVTLVPRGWHDLRLELRAVFRRLGRVDSASVADLLVERRPS